MQMTKQISMWKWTDSIVDLLIDGHEVNLFCAGQMQ